ncbi:MAG: hypothetical protein QOD75_3797 [Blastocatellia bacterium]|nr:hypothetical protein [Blastocatellia bacterium]
MSLLNRSAECVLAKSNEQRVSMACVEKCLQRLTPQERTFILRAFDDQSQPPTDLRILGISNIRVKRARARLAKCIRKCRAEMEEQVLEIDAV